MKKNEIRLAKTHLQNRNYLTALDKFINSPRFQELSGYDRALILDQASAMSQLDEILTARLKSLNIPV